MRGGSLLAAAVRVAAVGTVGSRTAMAVANLALYRKYRSATFAEVIGQDTSPTAAAALRPADQPRLPVQRPARLRQDLQRAHPGPLA